MSIKFVWVLMVYTNTNSKAGPAELSLPEDTRDRHHHPGAAVVSLRHGSRTKGGEVSRENRQLPLPSLTDICRSRCLSRATSITKDPSADPLFNFLPSGRRHPDWNHQTEEKLFHTSNNFTEWHRLCILIGDLTSYCFYLWFTQLHICTL